MEEKISLPIKTKIAAGGKKGMIAKISVEELKILIQARSNFAIPNVIDY